jgi:hypothetical protein
MALMMSSLIDRLNNLETRLQSLIEEGMARILPNANKRLNMSSMMVAAMKSSIREDDSGKLTAADLYILTVNQETAQLLTEKPGLIDDLSQLISQAGVETGVEFTNLPRVKMSMDDSLDSGKFDVSAQFTLQEVGETSTLTIRTEDGFPIPEYAFLIINGMQIFPLNQPVVNLGRRVDNHVVIEDLRVSRVHAQIRAIKGHYVIFDLDSSGGTFVNGVRSIQAMLYPGDVISLAGVDIVYGQDATYLSNDDHGSTQPLIPFPGADD